MSARRQKKMAFILVVVVATTSIVNYLRLLLVSKNRFIRFRRSRALLCICRTSSKHTFLKRGYQDGVVLRHRLV